MNGLTYSCYPCNKVFNGPVPYKSHVKSKKHNLRVSGAEEPFKTSLKDLGADSESLASGPHAALFRKSQPYSFCELCKVRLNSRTSEDIHYKGKKHQQNLRNESYRCQIVGGSEREAAASASSPGLETEGASSNCTLHWNSRENPPSPTYPRPLQSAESTSLPEWDRSTKRSGVTSSPPVLAMKQGPKSTPTTSWIPPTQERDLDPFRESGGQDLSCKPCGILLFKSLEYKLEHLNTTAHKRKVSQILGYPAATGYL